MRKKPDKKVNKLVVHPVRHHKIKQADTRRKYIYCVRFYFPRCLGKCESGILVSMINELLVDFRDKR